MAELLLELFSEEIPARMQRQAGADLKRLVEDGLKAANLKFKSARALATPRRLTLVVDGLPTAQPDQREERRGPRVDAPEKALQGFLKANNTTLEDCEQRETTKGTFLYVTIEHKGRPTKDVLAEIIPGAMAKLPWPKSMRWGSGDTRWVRPLHNILALFDGGIVDFQFADLTANKEVRGHRFHAPEIFTPADFADYQAKLRDAFVIVDPAERRELIVSRSRQLAAEHGLALLEDNELLDELAGLVEWPVPLMGRIDERFMAVPAEVLITTMKVNQKYLTLNDGDGKLAPNFITVANMAPRDGGQAIMAGNQYVLTARLSDAEFFWNLDRKTALADRIASLDTVVFHARLGSLGEKVQRVTTLTAYLAEHIPGADAAVCQRAAQLAKADLTSEMVGEFASLQGTMGRYYANHDGETADVAQAIAEHYAPQGPNDNCPTAPTSVAVALADKLDTLLGFWMIDEKPTGSKDPYALRRAALGVIRLILENNLRLSLLAVFDRALSLYGAHSNDKLTRDLLTFFGDRLKVHLREQGVRHDLINAIFNQSVEDDLVRLLDRVEALATFVDSNDGADMLTAYRRAANILRIEEKKDRISYDAETQSDLMTMDQEKALDGALMIADHGVDERLRAEDYPVVMAELSRLREPLDAFFDDVTVNAEDAELRTNRLKLLSKIRQTFHQVAEFSEIEG
jgi:glycyl-tRNA synthetase beta chain